MSGGIASLTLSFSSAGGVAPAALQWTLTYPAADIQSIQVTEGPALTDAGKSVACAGNGGSYICVASGMNYRTIADGVVANILVTPVSGVTETSLGVSGLLGASAAGGSIVLAAPNPVTIDIVPLPPPPAVTSLACNPAPLNAPGSSTCTVAISSAAPGAGTPVTLSSTPGILSAPSSVTIPANSVSATFNVTAAMIDDDQNATITASLNGSTQSTVLPLISPARLQALACSPSPIASGASGTCTVTLTKAAPAGGATVAISGNNAALSVPASVTVNTAATSATFAMSAGNVSSDQNVIVSASLNGSTQSAAVTVGGPALVSSLVCSPSALAPGASSTCTVGISKAAPAGGATVAIASDNSAAVSTPASVVVPAAASAATFAVTAKTVSSDQNATVSVSLNGSTQSAAVTVATPALVSALVCSPSSLAAGTSGSCAVTLSKAAPAGGAAIAISRDNAVLSVPASVMVNAAASSATFAVAAGNCSSDEGVTVSASFNGSTKAAAVTVTSAALVSYLSCAPSSLAAGASSTCTVGISKSAPAGGTTIAVTNNNSSAVSAPASVAVPAAASSTTFAVTANTVSSDQSAIIGVSLNGSTKAGAVTVTAPVLVSSLACSPSTLAAGSYSTCTATLMKMPSGPTAIALASSSTSLPVPASMLVYGGRTYAKFVIFANASAADQTVTLTATLNGAATTTSVVLGSNPSLTSLVCAPTTLPSAGVGTCTVTLDRPASSAGTVVNIASNNGLLTAPSSIVVPPQATYAVFDATAGIITANTSAALTASLNGLSRSTNFSLQSGPAVTSLQCTLTTLPVGNATSCNVKLVNVTGATTVALNSSAPAALMVVQPTLVIPAGYTTGMFTVVSIASFSGWSTVTATLGISAKSAQFTQSDSSGSKLVSRLSCEKTSLVSGSSTHCSVQLKSPAAGGGSSIRLSSTNPRVRVPDAVQVPEGAAAAEFTVQSQPSDQEEATAVIAAANSDARQSLSLSGAKPASVACAPHTVRAGDSFTCEVHLNSSEITETLVLDVTSDSADLRLPAAIHTRPRQSSLAFQVLVAADAREQSAGITVAFGAGTAQDSVAIQPGAAPVLTVPERQLGRFGARMHFTVAANDPAGLPVRLAGRDLPAGAVFQAETGAFDWTPARSQQGTHELTFSATNSAGASVSRLVKLTVDSGAPAIREVVNAATRQPRLACSPGSIATILGKWLAAEGMAATDPTGNSLVLADVRVNVNESPVPVLSVAPDAVNILCPQLAAGTPLEISVETGNRTTNPVRIAMSAAGPGIFSLDASGQGLVASTGTSMLAKIRDYRAPGQPAQAADQLSILVTGLASDAVSAPPPLVKLGEIYATGVTVRPVDGSAGLYEVRFPLPESAPLGDRVPLVIQVPGADSTYLESNVVTLATEPVRP